MKNVKKLLALLLAMTMLFALCACGEKGNKKEEEKALTDADLNGEWTLTATPAALEMDQLFPFEGFEYNEKLTVKAVFEDGTLDLYTDGMAKWVENMVRELYQWIQTGENIYIFLATTNGMDVDEFKADCAENGVTTQDLLDELAVQITEEILVENIMSDLGSSETITHSFEIKDNTLTFDKGAVWTVDVSENKIIVTEIQGEDGTMKLGNDGMVFSK